MTVTPSPQSVVVPVDLAETPAIRNTLGLLRSAVLCGEQWSDTCRDAYLAALKELDQLAMLAAAPAPSSLAGGEVSAAVDHLTKRLNKPGRFHLDDEPRLRTILAALSPEAPAREGEETLRTALIKARSELAIQYCYSAGRMGIAGCYPELAEKYGGSAIVQEIDAVLALTPRHEAPAEGAGDGHMSDCAIHNTPALPVGPCDCGSPFLTPEDIKRAHELRADPDDEDNERFASWYGDTLLEVHQLAIRLDAALRARSSAPEGEEALGNLLAVIHGDGGHRALEVGTKQAALEAEKIVAGLFAAPSADKLRGIVQRCVNALDASRNGGEFPDFEEWEADARQALAALKAEGC